MGVACPVQVLIVEPAVVNCKSTYFLRLWCLFLTPYYRLTGQHISLFVYWETPFKCYSSWCTYTLSAVLHSIVVCSASSAMVWLCSSLWFHIVVQGMLWFHFVVHVMLWFHFVVQAMLWFHIVVQAMLWFHFVVQTVLQFHLFV